MKPITTLFCLMLLCLMLLITVPFATAQEKTGDGQVELPLNTYNDLVNSSRLPIKIPVPPPASYALGTATMTVNVAGVEPRATAEITVQLQIKVLEDGWTAIPVLAAGTPVSAASVDGSAVQLITTASGLAWGIDKKGSYTMQLTYKVDAARSDAGFSLGVPTPPGAAVNLTATLPGSGLDIAIIPSAGSKTQTYGSNTRITATIPATNGVQISWRRPTTEGHSVGRADYSGQLTGDAVNWRGEISVEVFSDDSITLDLLPRTTTLRDITVDGKKAPIMVHNNSFATLIKGRGQHLVVIGFQTSVTRSGGPPKVDLTIPQVPVSRVVLTLPGKKEISVSPASNVESRFANSKTTATVYIPMTSAVNFTWAEAVPEAIKAEVRANAGLYHLVHAEEGVLYVHALVTYEISRGETSSIVLEVPADVQVNRISSPSGAVADWRMNPSKDRREVTIFLDRKIEGELLLEILYDRSLSTGEQVATPLLSAPGAQRQRGMVALLASKDLTLKPLDEDALTRVGENQLPAFVREKVELTVAHTFKYVETTPNLVIETSKPERKQGRFDAQVDTLASLDVVTLRCSATIELNVKSGGIMDLALNLPSGVNLLSLAGPSIRTHTVNDEDSAQRIDVHFTQEMEGQFRLEVNYEHILVDSEASVEVPTISVRGAEVEQGRLAIEALSAVEVQATTTDSLLALDINELPQQLVLRTTNPILMAYKYVTAETPTRLVLTVTRHKVVDVQEAAIDEAHYRTLFTSDGLAVTTARFVVRNSRKQFLRIELPKDSEVWSAFVDGRPEKPALGEGGDADSVLIKIITSTRGFPVQLVYATSGSKIRGLGRLRSTLPSPDILVTHTRWDVYVPEGLSYGALSSNMEIELPGVLEKLETLSDEMMGASEDGARQRAVEPLRIAVPSDGWHYAFKKLYANQGDETAWFTLAYASGGGAKAGSWFSLIGTGLLWLGLGLLLKPHPSITRNISFAMLASGAIIMIITLGFLHVSATPAVVLSMLVILGHAARWIWQKRMEREIDQKF